MDPIIDDVTFTVRNHNETGGAGRRRQGWGWRRDIGLNRRTLFRPAPSEKKEISPSAATSPGPVDPL